MFKLNVNHNIFLKLFPFLKYQGIENLDNRVYRNYKSLQDSWSVGEKIIEVDQSHLLGCFF